MRISVHTLVLLVLFVHVVILQPTTVAAICPRLDDRAAAARIADLSAQIRHHNRLYYQQHRSEISDTDFDRLVAELKGLEGCFPHLAAADSPTRMIDDEKPGEMSIRHEQPMLGLASSTDAGAVRALLQRQQITTPPPIYSIEPKIDGLPVELCYEQGLLVAAATRGDGEKGTDVTVRAHAINGIPSRLTPPHPRRLVLRGEVYADLQSFRTLPPEQAYATPRHLASAVLRSASPAPAALACLRFFPVEVVASTPPLPDDSALEQLRRLPGYGLPDSTTWIGTGRTLAEIRTARSRWLARRAQLPFAIDGIVVKFDDPHIRQQLGDGPREPFWAAAWKFPPATARTTVTGIDWSVGRTGRRTPVAMLHPVEIAGVQVSRASLHNAEQLARLNLVVGDEVIVALSGDVIPQIIDVVGKPETEVIDFPTDKEPAIDTCLAVSADCRQQFLARAIHFCGKQGLGIDGLGEKRLAALIDAEKITDLPSILELQPATLDALNGVGPLQAEEMAAMLLAARQAPPHQLLAALGLPGIGPATCKSVTGRFASFSDLINSDAEQLAGIPGVGNDAANTLQAFIASDGGQRLLKRLFALGID